MGWSGGTEIMDSIVACLKNEIIDTDKRKNIYVKLIRVLADQDWDTICECTNKDKAFWKAAKEV